MKTNPGDQNNSGNKKLKLRHARQIHTQKLDSDNSKLPAFLDVERFINARSFEIGAMEKAMKSAREAGSLRAFQTLPRHLRRRTASHVARRVPSRLRSKSRFEMKNSKPKVQTRSIARKLRYKAYKNQHRTSKLLKRQYPKKQWLATHIWHAKRTKMVDIWGFRLAQTPTEKCYRSTYRANKHGFTLHDLSYYTHLTLTGEQALMIETLKRICDPLGVDPCSTRFIMGHRAVELMLFTDKGWPKSLIGPAMLIWRPQSKASSSSPSPSASEPWLGPSRLEPTDANTALSCQSLRSVLLQIHPSMKTQVIESINLASSAKVAVKESDELGCLELGGPRCFEMMSKVLLDIDNKDNDKDEVKNWLELGVKPSAMPTGMIIGITVDDPRLHFPPKTQSTRLEHINVKVAQPDVRHARCERFWDPKQQQATKRYQKSDIDRRRAVLEIPGAELVRTELDDRISILLARSGSGWKMFLPFGWVQAFFHSFIFTSARLICLDQRAQLSFECGAPTFPRDFPTLLPCIEWADRFDSEEAARWARKPPAKRVNYQLMDAKGGGGGDPFVADWKVVIGQKGIERNKRGEILVEAGGQGEVNFSNHNQPWLLVGPLVRMIIENIIKLVASGKAKSSAENLCEMAPRLMNGIVQKLKWMLFWIEPNLKIKQEDLPWDLALVMVKLLSVGSGGKAGVIKPMARLYWNKQTNQDSNHNELIGLITTGNYSLTKGSSAGFGAISMKKLIEMIIHQKYTNNEANCSENFPQRRLHEKFELKVSYRNKHQIDHDLGVVELLD
ncbi:hypothetical protein O181_069494 [Austropuccinia psidii MF-1]|uniref:Uncharacterized protein n=1 Tax=Austropuccinia psidii MF-1 TaxID=1389203 RepID=A0A9Q3I8K4_9BASI|nr:hypothetical protein [Austropuccinia psidii MF-1]